MATLTTIPARPTGETEICRVLLTIEVGEQESYDSTTNATLTGDAEFVNDGTTDTTLTGVRPWQNGSGNLRLRRTGDEGGFAGWRATLPTGTVPELRIASDMLTSASLHNQVIEMDEINAGSGFYNWRFPLSSQVWAQAERGDTLNMVLSVPIVWPDTGPTDVEVSFAAETGDPTLTMTPTGVNAAVVSFSAESGEPDLTMTPAAQAVATVTFSAETGEPTLTMTPFEALPASISFDATSGDPTLNMLPEVETLENLPTRADRIPVDDVVMFARVDDVSSEVRL